MSEYIIDMGNSSYKSSSGLLCADVSQLRGEIVRCRDCKHYGCDGYDDHYCYYWDKIREPDGFCAWGSKAAE